MPLTDLKRASAPAVRFQILYILFMPKFEKHIFICGNQRPQGHPRGSCDPEAKGELHAKFKLALTGHGIAGTRVRANKSGCMEQCEHGPTVVVYPDAIWYGRVTPNDVEEIVASHIVGGKAVERLVLPDACINTATCEHKPRRN